MATNTANFTVAEFLCRCCGGGADILHQELLDALQVVRTDWNNPLSINCGYRCPAHNAAVGGAPSSAHQTGQACDVYDPDGSLKAWIAPLLEKYGLYMEAPHYTSNWCHLQTRPTASGNRVFIP